MEGLTKLMMAAAVMIVTMAASTEAAKAEERMVYVGGGRETWGPNRNFTEWSSRQHFYVGNWLYFGFDKSMYSVLEVNKTSYEACTEVGFIHNITRGGRDVFKLTEARNYYFISGGGACFNGLKVAINVEKHPPAPTPAPAKSSAPSQISTVHFAFALVAVLATGLSTLVL
ncbi:Lamin-like protein [Linum grandiflorum]